MMKRIALLLIYVLSLIIIVEDISLTQLSAKSKKTKSITKKGIKGKPLKKIVSKNNPKKAKTSIKLSSSQKKGKICGKSKIIDKSKIITKTVVVFDTLLSDGVRYYQIKMPIGKCHHSVHVIEADLEQPDVVLEMLKAKNLASGLQKLHDIVRINDSVNNTKVLGAVNANFWKAYSNRPIGPAISGGEIVELPAHKRWSTCLVSDDKQLFIDNFIITGQLETADDNLFEINSVNSRNDSLGNILYNRFAGDSIPQLTYQAPVLEQDTTNEDFFIDDSTEENFDIAKYKSEKASGFIIDDIEYYLPKISLKYLDDPAINERTPCLVTSINTGVLSIPDDGCIITVGRDTPVDLMPKKGDTVYVEFSTNIHNDIIFVSGFSGTPRLVRNGNPKNEAAYEGNHGRRFMNKQLPRTAIGTDKSMKKAIIVAVEPSCRSERRSGASLQQMANIMKKLGCLNAMNLDGGGSTSMLINGKNVIYKGRPEAGRKISAAAAIMKKGV